MVLVKRVKDQVTEAVISMRRALLLGDAAKAGEALESIETGAKVRQHHAGGDCSMISLVETWPLPRLAHFGL